MVLDGLLQLGWVEVGRELWMSEGGGGIEIDVRKGKGGQG